MTIWILAAVLMAGSASAGYFYGALRVLFSTVGIILGIFLATTLAPAVMPILPFFGISSPWAKELAAPIVAFLLVGIVFKVIGHTVHRKLDYFMKYSKPDAIYALWDQMNRRIGAVIAILNAAMYFMVCCVIILITGYFVNQVGGSESNSFVLKTVSKMAADLKETRMDKVVGGLVPAPESYYETCDFMGFILQNRQLVKRIQKYPPFYALSHPHEVTDRNNPSASSESKSPMQDLVCDNEFWKTLETETDPAVLLANARVQQIMTNADLRTELSKIDVTDLKAFMSTGKSPKYEDEKILGNWVYDFPSSLAMAKQLNPNMLASEMIRTRRELAERFDKATMTATLEDQISVRIPTANENTRLPSVTNAPPRISYMGTWRRGSSSYTIDLHSFKGNDRKSSSEAKVLDIGKARRIVFRIENRPVCFVRLPD